MKNLKIMIIATTIAVLAVATIGVALAYNYNNSPNYGGMMGSSSPNEDEDWWTEMRDHMDDHMDEVQDEEWFDEMTEHMEDHMDDIEDEDWFDEMDEHMDDMMDSHDHDDDSQNSRHGCH